MSESKTPRTDAIADVSNNHNMPDDIQAYHHVLTFARTLELELNEAKKTLPLNSKQRLIDLVRYARQTLHKDELITDEEYAELCSITESPKRLMECDELHSQLTTAQQDLKVLTDFFDANPNHLASQLKKAQQEIAELKSKHIEAVSAAWRLRFYSYHDWSLAGGMDECKHGIAKGIHCERCDEILIRTTYDSAMKGTKE